VKNVPPAEEVSGKDKQKSEEESGTKTDGDKEKKDEVEELVGFS